jgi:uncharacterized C2H2 Zn-finger protein
MNKSAKIFLCEYCDYKSNRRYNLTQHVVIKHIEVEKTDVKQNEQNSIPNCQKDTPNEQNSIPNEQNSIPFVAKLSPNTLHEKQCHKCEKILSSSQNYIRHVRNCNGKINPLQCIHCKEIFTLSHNKYRHQKKCKVKLQAEAAAAAI